MDLILILDRAKTNMEYIFLFSKYYMEAFDNDDLINCLKSKDPNTKNHKINILKLGCTHQTQFIDLYSGIFTIKKHLNQIWRKLNESNDEVKSAIKSFNKSIKIRNNKKWALLRKVKSKCHQITFVKYLF